MNNSLPTQLSFPEAELMQQIGIETLHRMRSVKTYNDWCYRAVAPYVGTSVLEVGCGIGNMTAYFADRERLVALDILEEAVALVGSRHADAPNVRIMLGDICDDVLVQRLAAQPFDSCVSFNVLEHIRDDGHAFANMARLLKPGGHCAMVVPACAALYGTLDANLGHYRRYEPDMLRRLIDRAGMEPVKIAWMNFPGMFGWFLTARVVRRPILPRGPLSIFNLLAPLFMRIESVWQPPIGQSLICVARKPDA